MAIQDDVNRYQAALHAMQSGVKQEMSMPHRASATEPKHLRVGVNAAMVDHAGLISLLIDKGLFTQAEYTRYIADAMETEKARYESELSAALGIKVTLV